MLPISAIRTVPGDLDRRWMSDDFFDLIVWYEADERVHGFQLCYDKEGHERALTWTRETGFLHTSVDAGEFVPTANRTPILTSGGSFSGQQVKHEFSSRSVLLPAEIRDMILTRIGEYDSLQLTGLHPPPA